MAKPPQEIKPKAMLSYVMCMVLTHDCCLHISVYTVVLAEIHGFREFSRILQKLDIVTFTLAS